MSVDNHDFEFVKSLTENLDYDTLLVHLSKPTTTLNKDQNKILHGIIRNNTKNLSSTEKSKIKDIIKNITDLINSKTK